MFQTAVDGVYLRVAMSGERAELKSNGVSTNKRAWRLCYR